MAAAAAVTIRKVLICEPVDLACVTLLKSHAIDVSYEPDLKRTRLLAIVKDFDAMIVRSATKVDGEIIGAAANLKVVCRAGVGYDNIDVPACTARNIFVINSPTGNVLSACELTCAAILNLSRNVIAANNSLKNGEWNRKMFVGNEVFGKTLAIIGFGRVGRQVAVRMQSFGMKVIASDPFVKAADAAQLSVELMDLASIWSKADYLTVHTPIIHSTKDLVDETVLRKCKKGVRIVNVARGGIVNESALLAALQTGQCAGAALDVFEHEPPTACETKALIAHPNVYVTPHLGASTVEAQSRVAIDVTEQLLHIAANDRIIKNLAACLHGLVNRELLKSFN